MTVKYEVTDEKTCKTVIEAWTKHCFTDKNLKPINMKKHSSEINNIFEKLLKEGE